MRWKSDSLIELSDAQLLVEYVDARGRDKLAEAAFRELVDRHGPMVLGICRQILRRQHDADDAFQATFLVLVRKARLRKLIRNALVILFIGSTSGSLVLWAHWPAAPAKKSTLVRGPVPALAPEEAAAPARDAASTPQPAAKPPTPPQPGADDVRLTDHPEGPIGGLPADCPISIAATAFSKVIDRFHHSSEPSH